MSACCKQGFGEFKESKLKLCQVRTGVAKTGQVRMGKVMRGQARTGQVEPKGKL